MDPPPPPPLRIRLPGDIADRDDGDVLPPLDPPPFHPARAIECVKISQPVVNYDGSHEILILTSIVRSLDEALDDDVDRRPGGGDDDVMEDGSDDDAEMDDESRTSSSLSSIEDVDDKKCDDDGGEKDPPPANNRGSLEAFKVCWGGPLRQMEHGGFPTHVYHAQRLRREDIGWIETGETVAIKEISFQCIRANRNRLSEDFYKEAAALHYISNSLRDRPIEETHVLTADTVMCTNTHLYFVMPYCDGGDLFDRVAYAERTRLTENEARYYFEQILIGLETLQRLRICHKDLSPENLMLLGNNSLIIDFGMCLRIPYTADARHLITPRTPCGKLPHVSPEVYLSRPLDGHATEIWAAGTILLFMLAGTRFRLPPLNDGALDAFGNLFYNLGISNEAVDLLKQILRFDPNNRLTLEQIRAHPWMTF